jgi:drug/metabolite transporter (DMT)-like permease
MRLPAGRAHPGLGITLLLCAVCCFAGLDTSTRYLGQFLPVLVFFWWRYTFQASVMAVWLAVWPSRQSAGRAVNFRTTQPRFQLLRGLLLLATSAMSFYGLQRMPVPEFTAISMIAPLLVVVLAAWHLHEPVTPLRWALVAGGCIGMLIIVRPGSGVFGWAVAFPLAGALSYAYFQVLTRKLAGHESPYTTHFYTGLVGAAALTPVLVASGVPLATVLQSAAPRTLLVLFGLGLFATAGHLLLILALRVADTASLMPFVYVQIAAAAGLAWWVFGHLPDGWAVLGMAVIAGCGAASVWLNVRQIPAAPAPTSSVG